MTRGFGGQWCPSGYAAAGAALAITLLAAPSFAQSKPLENPHGSRIVREADIAVQQPGPHDGGGITTGYPFFEDIKDVPFFFRKRVLHPGAAIGAHEQKEDEAYYVVSGTGNYTLDGQTVKVGPGTALLTRKGSTHSLRQTGTQDLVIFISYLRPSPVPSTEK